MRSSLLIAWREYRQYVFSRGFLIFMVMFPVGVLVGGAAVSFVERARPIREFVVFDQTGMYAPIIDESLADRRALDLLAAWNAYLEAAIDRTRSEPSEITEPFGAGEITLARSVAFEAAGGGAAGMEIVRPLLRRGAPEFTAPRQSFRRLDLPPEAAAAPSTAAAADALRPYLLAERNLPGGSELFAAILIPPGFGASADGPPAEYWSRNLTDPALELAVSRALDSAMRRTAAADFGITPETLDALADVTAPMEAFRPDKGAADAKLNTQDRIRTAVLPAVMTYMLLVIIFAVGNLLLTNTIEERSNKIVEVLLSSVTADQLMFGKLLGIAAVGLTMPTVFLVGAGLVALGGSLGGSVAQEAVIALLTSHLIPVYLFYFFAAYVIFAMIFLAIGAVSNSLQDAQSYMGPVMLLVFAPLPFMVMVFQNPNGLVASILTWIPIYTPYAVMMRAAANPPLWEILGATCLMLAFAIFLARIMGRIFKRAILSSSPPRAKEIWRLMRAEEA